MEQSRYHPIPPYPKIPVVQFMTQPMGHNRMDEDYTRPPGFSPNVRSDHPLPEHQLTSRDYDQLVPPGNVPMDYQHARSFGFSHDGHTASTRQFYSHLDPPPHFPQVPFQEVNRQYASHQHHHQDFQPRPNIHELYASRFPHHQDTQPMVR